MVRGDNMDKVSRDFLAILGPPPRTPRPLGERASALAARVARLRHGLMERSGRGWYVSAGLEPREWVRTLDSAERAIARLETEVAPT